MKERKWRAFPLTSPTNHKQAPYISPTPEKDRIKTARISGQGVGLLRNTAQDKERTVR